MTLLMQATGDAADILLMIGVMLAVLAVGFVMLWLFRRWGRLRRFLDNPTRSRERKQFVRSVVSGTESANITLRTADGH